MGGESLRHQMPGSEDQSFCFRSTGARANALTSCTGNHTLMGLIPVTAEILSIKVDFIELNRKQKVVKSLM